MTNSRPFRWLPPTLTALLACVLLASAATAQEAPPPERDDRTAVLFRVGMQSLTAAQQADDEDARQELYDRAIAAFRLILVNRPELIRVRLELARTFFLNGQDGLARRHFELVLAGGVPPPVAANIRRFMTAMQTRKRFTGYFGAAFAPDSNLNAASESEIIYIDTTIGRLPFTREGRFRRPLRPRRVGVGRRRVPAPPERTAAAAGGRRPGAARIQRQRLRPVVRSRARRAALAGQPDYRDQPAGHRAAPMARRRSPTRTRPACAWSSTAG